jgi:hypothetical protein
MVVGEKHLTTAVVHFIQQLYRQEHEQQQQQRVYKPCTV